MIHAQTVTEKQLASLKELNCIVSFFNAHTYFWGDIHAKPRCTRRAHQPMQTAQALGLCYTLHQDTPVIEPNMLFIRLRADAADAAGARAGRAGMYRCLRRAAGGDDKRCVSVF